ncbi:MAG: hypothetical protein ACRD44_10005, partial [Bryobacteraceae bacterium]
VRLALTGAGIGLAGAVGLTRFLGSMLAGVTPLDPAAFVLAAALLAAVTLAACWAPARRATRVEPVRALRYE